MPYRLRVRSTRVPQTLVVLAVVYLVVAVINAVSALLAGVLWQAGVATVMLGAAIALAWVACTRRDTGP
jgi:hypothetical protein